MAKKGEKMSEETKLKMSLAQKGRPGRKKSPEEIEKFRESIKRAWADGRMYSHHTEDTKAKISQNRKGKATGNVHGFQKGQTPWNKGIKHNVHTPEWRAKVSAANRGENHWNYKGGITYENRKLRNSAVRKEWTMNVFKRDFWTCQKCGFHGQKPDMIAHHVKPWSSHHELRFDVSNGITLCRACHCALHKPRTGTGKPPKPRI